MKVKRKPKFLRQNWITFKSLRKVKWRKTRGIHSKMFRGEKGKARMPRIGYSMPRSVSGLHPCGLREVLVSNVAEMKRLDAKKDAARISSMVGRKKRLAMIEAAKEIKVKILNPK
jgi:large subunit ribosomal protein L32e